MVAHRLGRAVCEFNADLAVGRETAVLVVERDDEVEHPALGRGRILGAANGDAARGANRHFFYNSGQGPCSDLRSSDPTILPESLIAQIASSPVTTPSVASECARLQIPYRIVQARNFWATEALGAGSSPISAASARSSSGQRPWIYWCARPRPQARMSPVGYKNGNRLCGFLLAGST